MTKNDLIRELAVSEKLHLSTATKAIDGLIRILKQNLAEGQTITIRGFATLTPVKREERSAVDFTKPDALPTSPLT